MPWFLLIAVGAGLLIIGLAARALRGETSRAPHLRALVAGEVSAEELPAAVLRHLNSTRHRAGLASALHKIAVDAGKLPKLKILPSPNVTQYHGRSIADQIAEVATIVGDPGTDPRAVALAELLLEDGRSALHGAADDPLVDALAEIRRLA